MIGESLPQAELARVEGAKLKGYLLNHSHLRGKAKAQFFRARGFTDEAWEAMAEALRHHALHNPISGAKETSFGINYALDCRLPTPDQSNPCIRSVWEITPEDRRPRLITAHPLG